MKGFPVRIVMVLLVAAIAAAALFFLFVRPAHAPNDGADSGKLQVAATIFPLADWAREVGGDNASVYCLVDGTKNPHHFEASISDAKTTTRAKAMLTVGLGMDPWAQKLAANSGGEIKVFTTSAWIAPMKMEAYRQIEIHGNAGDEDDDHAGSDNPHFWLDPARAAIVVKHLGEEFGKLDPAHKDGYEKRAAAYIAKLEETSKEIDRLAANMPAGTQLVTFHDAYGYLFARLKIKIAAVVQVSPGIEPSAKDVVEAVKLMQSLKQQVVFREPGANVAALNTLAKELNARVELLDPMDTEISEVGKTYLERLKYDLRTLGSAEGIQSETNGK